MLNLNSVMIGTKQPAALAAFYEKVLGKPADMVDQDMVFGDGRREVRTYPYWSIPKWEEIQKIPGA